MACLHGELGCIAQIVAGADENAAANGYANHALRRAGLQSLFAGILPGVGAPASATGAPAPGGGNQEQRLAEGRHR
eukprot:588343-Alexandrium_andersonii.AAC.1